MAKLSIVIPWIGENLKGGAERQAWRLAANLQADNNQVKILSTCSRSFHHSWSENYYRPQTEKLISGVEVQRFPVIKRSPKLFQQVVNKLLAIPPSKLHGIPLSYEEENIYWQHNINSPKLIDHLRTTPYDFCIFLPYLFSPVCDGVLAVPHKALLQPCLHQEGYAFLRRSRAAVTACKKLLFNSRGEQQLAMKIYGDIKSKSQIVGEGVDKLAEPEKIDFPWGRQKYLLYLGRRCHEKNTPLLIKAFEKYKDRGGKLALVLAGPGPKQTTANSIYDLGLVTEGQKTYLLKNCQTVVNPSYNESFSLLLHEAWLCNKPVIGHRDCEAVALALKKNLAWDSNSFADLFHHAENFKEENTKEYVEKNCSWPVIQNKYKQIFTQKPKPQKNRLIIIYPNQDPSGLLHPELQLLLETEDLHIICKQALPLCAKKLQTLDLKDKLYPNDVIIWYGPLEWPEAINILKHFPGKKILRDPHSQKKPELFDQLIGFYPGAGLAAKALTPLKWHQRQHTSVKNLLHSNYKKTRGLFFGDQTVECTAPLSTPTKPTPHDYLSHDFILIAGNPKNSAAQLIKSQAYKLPALSYKSPLWNYILNAKEYKPNRDIFETINKDTAQPHPDLPNIKEILDSYRQ